MLGDTWVRASGAWRNLRTGAITPVGRGTFAIIGDSTTYQGGNGENNIRTILADNGWAPEDIYWYAVNGKAINYRDSEGGLTVEQIAEAKTLLGAVDTWVIALGSNGAANYVPADIEAIFAAIGSHGHICWMGIGNRDPNPTRAAFNDMAEAEVTRLGGTWFDYETRAFTFPSTYWNSDGLHMPPQGYAAKNAFMIEQLGRVV